MLTTESLEVSTRGISPLLDVTQILREGAKGSLERKDYESSRMPFEDPSASSKLLWRTLRLSSRVRLARVRPDVRALRNQIAARGEPGPLLRCILHHRIRATRKRNLAFA